MWLKRAVAVTLGLTMLILGTIVVWGMGFSSADTSTAVETSDALPTIAAVTDTQPGSSQGDGQTIQASPTPADASQPTAAPATSGGGTSSGGTSGGGSTGGGSAPQPTAAPTPAPTTPPAGCGSGGNCHLSDIQGHGSAGDCRTAINIDGTTSAYAPSQTFLTNHGNEFKQIVSKLCGKVYTANLRQAVSEHANGTTLSGNTFQQYLNNFYIGPYN